MKLSDKMPKEISNPMVKDFSSLLGKTVETVLKVVSKRLQESKDQKKFLLLTLSDRTGSVRAVDWYNAQENDSRVKSGDVLKVRGRLVYFEDRIQLNIDRDPGSVRVLSEGEYDPSRFVSRSERDPEELLREAERLIHSLRDREIRDLLMAIFKDRNLREVLKEAPAGVKVHHAYIGGLLEHSLTVAKMADRISGFYDLNRDLLVAGALIHDIGKAIEYTIGPSGIEVTTEGELKGHIIAGLEIVREFSKRVRISKEKLLEIEHIIASHHGDFEYGSPVLPKTPEALVVHFLENMDAKLARFFEIKDKAEPGKEWSDYDRNLGRRIFLRGDRIQNG